MNLAEQTNRNGTSETSEDLTEFVTEQIISMTGKGHQANIRTKTPWPRKQIATLSAVILKFIIRLTSEIDCQTSRVFQVNVLTVICELDQKKKTKQNQEAEIQQVQILRPWTNQYRLLLDVTFMLTHHKLQHGMHWTNLWLNILQNIFVAGLYGAGCGMCCTVDRGCPNSCQH